MPQTHVGFAPLEPPNTMPNPNDKLPEGTPIGTDEQGKPIYEDAASGDEQLKAAFEKLHSNIEYKGPPPTVWLVTVRGPRKIEPDELHALLMLDDDNRTAMEYLLQRNPDARARIEGNSVVAEPITFTLKCDQTRRHGIIKPS